MSGTYLLEIGVEELPAAHIPEAQTRLTNLFTEALGEQTLPFKKIGTFATPRRLTVFIEGLPDKQPTIEKKVRGPRYDVGFESDGTAKKPAIGFAKKNGIEVEQLEKEKVGDTEYIVANVTIEGKDTAEILAQVVPDVINHVSGERLMRWGNYDFKFSRPIRWIVSLLDKDVVDFKINNISSGRESYGHRILAPGAIQLDEPSVYEERLKESRVLVDQKKRKDIILKQVEQLSQDAGGVPGRLDTDLLDEVVNITEWPHALRGTFADDYLRLPDALLETIMVHHQRYFPIQKENTANGDSIKTNNLLPYFITIANNDLEEARDSIRQGNERVLRARLADGKFFYFDDQKRKLDDRVSELDQLTYQHGLGSYLAKRDRLVVLAEHLSASLNLEPALRKHLKRAVELAKLDLVTNLVGELPELQGYVGAWYAAEEGEDESVARAIASHYAPRHTDDSIPGDPVGLWAGVIDKIDHLTGLFALGKRPTGSSDPFALRRNAQGLVDILVDGLSDYPVDLADLIDFLLLQFEPQLKDRKKGFEPDKIKAELQEFILQRLRGKLMDLEIGREVVDCVLMKKEPLKEISTAYDRCRVIEEMLAEDGANDGGIALVRAGIRVSNILKDDSCDQVDESQISKEEERLLWQCYKEVEQKLAADNKLTNPSTLEDYKKMLDSMKPLTEKIDAFFEGVMVNDEDKKKRDLRHGILKKIDRHFKQIGEFKPLQPLLP